MYLGKWKIPHAEKLHVPTCRPSSGFASRGTSRSEIWPGFDAVAAWQTKRASMGESKPDRMTIPPTLPWHLTEVPSRGN